MIEAIELGSRRFLKPGKLRWLRALSWCVIMFILVWIAAAVASAAVYTLAALARGAPLDPAMVGSAPSFVHFLGMGITAPAAVAAYVGLVRLGEDRLPLELTPGPAAIELPIGLALGVAMMAVTVLVMWAAGWASLAPKEITDIWRALGATLQSGVVEEVAFRAVVLRLLWLAFGPWMALALSAFLFGALHIINPNADWFAALCIMVEAGIMLAAFYILTGRLWVSIGVHAGWNFAQGWIFGAAVSGTDLLSGGPLLLEPAEDVPAVLSGGAFGPESSLAGLLVGTLVGAATIALALKRGWFGADAARPVE